MLLSESVSLFTTAAKMTPNESFLMLMLSDIFAHNKFHEYADSFLRQNLQITSADGTDAAEFMAFTRNCGLHYHIHSIICKSRIEQNLFFLHMSMTNNTGHLFPRLPQFFSYLAFCGHKGAM